MKSIRLERRQILFNKNDIMLKSLVNLLIFLNVFRSCSNCRTIYEAKYMHIYLGVFAFAQQKSVIHFLQNKSIITIEQSIWGIINCRHQTSCHFTQIKCKFVNVAESLKYSFQYKLNNYINNNDNNSHICTIMIRKSKSYDNRGRRDALS